MSSILFNIDLVCMTVLLYLHKIMCRWNYYMSNHAENLMRSICILKHFSTPKFMYHVFKQAGEINLEIGYTQEKQTT